MKNQNLVGIENISPLPNRIEILADERHNKVSEYKTRIDSAQASLNVGDIKKAISMAGSFDRIAGKITDLRQQIDRSQQELRRKINKTLSEGRILLNKVARKDNSQLRAASDLLISAKKHLDNDQNLPALLQAHQAKHLLKKMSSKRNQAQNLQMQKSPSYFLKK